MPLAALTPVLNDLLHKDGSSSSPYPSQTPNSVDSSNPTDYLRKPSISANQLSSVNDVSVICLLIRFVLGICGIDQNSTETNSRANRMKTEQIYCFFFVVLVFLILFFVIVFLNVLFISISSSHYVRCSPCN